MNRLVRSIVLLLALTVGDAALADATPEQMAQAKSEFEAGQVAYNLGQYDVALTRYTRSYELSKLPAILFNLAQVRRKLAERSGKLIDLREARELYRSYLRQVPFGADRSVAEGLAKEVDDAYTKALHDQRDKLLADAQGAAALGLAEDFLAQGDLASAETAHGRFVHTRGNKRAEVARGERVRARLFAARGDDHAAEDAWARALSLDPATAPPPESDPKSKPSFDKAVARMKGKAPLSLRHVPPSRVKIGQAPKLRFDIASDTLGIVKTLSLYYRAGGGAYASISVPPGEVTFPPEFNAGLQPGVKLEYRVEALDGDGAVIESLGTELLPFAITVDQKVKPLVKRWQFWVGLTAGVVVAAGVATGLGVGLAPPHREEIGVNTTPQALGR